MALATGFVLVLCQAVLIRSFLLNGTASTRITSYEFQLLSKLNLDEQSRITRLEDDVRALFKDQQALKDSKAALEIQLNITNSENISIRQKLNATEVTLGGQTKILKNVKAELDKEIANRHQLQVAYSTLTSNFHNLSVFVNSNTDDIGRLSDKTGKFI